MIKRSKPCYPLKHFFIRLKVIESQESPFFHWLSKSGVEGINGITSILPISKCIIIHVFPYTFKYQSIDCSGYIRVIAVNRTTITGPIFSVSLQLRNIETNKFVYIVVELFMDKIINETNRI